MFIKQAGQTFYNFGILVDDVFLLIRIVLQVIKLSVKLVALRRLPANMSPSWTWTCSPSSTPNAGLPAWTNAAAIWTRFPSKLNRSRLRGRLSANSDLEASPRDVGLILFQRLHEEAARKTRYVWD